jgi:hypothetical protein
LTSVWSIPPSGDLVATGDSWFIVPRGCHTSKWFRVSAWIFLWI